MTNALIALTNDIAAAEPARVAAPLLKIFSAITPQFYKNKTTDELRAEALSIELLTQSIPPPVLGDMCKLAVCNYPIARSNNDKVFFDINYLLTFFATAFNNRYCENVNLDGYAYCGYTINRDMWILNEHWRRDDGEEVTIMEVMNDKHKLFYNKGERVYSSAYWKKWEADNQKQWLNEKL